MTSVKCKPDVIKYNIYTWSVWVTSLCLVNKVRSVGHCASFVAMICSLHSVTGKEQCKKLLESRLLQKTQEKSMTKPVGSDIKLSQIDTLHCQRIGLEQKGEPWCLISTFVLFCNYLHLFVGFIFCYFFLLYLLLFYCIYCIYYCIKPVALSIVELITLGWRHQLVS